MIITNIRNGKKMFQTTNQMYIIHIYIYTHCSTSFVAIFSYHPSGSTSTASAALFAKAERQRCSEAPRLGQRCWSQWTPWSCSKKWWLHWGTWWFNIVWPVKMLISYSYTVENYRAPFCGQNHQWPDFPLPPLRTKWCKMVCKPLGHWPVPFFRWPSHFPPPQNIRNVSQNSWCPSLQFHDYFFHLGPHQLVDGIPTPLEKYEFVNWMTKFPNQWKNNPCSSHHQPVYLNPDVSSINHYKSP